MKNTIHPPKEKKQNNNQAERKSRADKHFIDPSHEPKDQRQADDQRQRDDSEEYSNTEHGDKNTRKISKEAKETMQECVTEFLLFVTSEANEICRSKKRFKILNSSQT